MAESDFQLTPIAYAGETEEQYVDTAKQAGGKAGGAARAAALTSEQRHQIAKEAAARFRQ